MADDRKRKDGEPILEFFWDPLEFAADQTYSTTLRIKLTGWWEGGRPREIAVSVYQRGQESSSGNAVRIQNGLGTYPLTGLIPGHHYLVVCYIGDRTPVQKMIAVPELPKPKSQEQESLERKETELARAKVTSELRKILTQEKKPTLEEKKTVALKARLERVKAEQELKEAERKLARELKRIKSPEPMATVCVSANPELAKEEKKPEKILGPPLSQRIREAYVQERNKGKPMFEFKIQRRRLLISLSDSPQGGQDGR